MRGGDWGLWRQKLDNFSSLDRGVFYKEEIQGNRLKAKFFSFCHPAGSVLDIGCGSGYNRRFLRNGQRYFGMDPLSIEDRYQFPFVNAVGEHLPFKDGVFEHVICIATLDHVAIPSKVIQECKRVLVSGGSINIMSSFELNGTFLNRLAVYLRLGLRKLLYGNFDDIARGFKKVFSKEEDEFHMHDFKKEELIQLCGADFRDIKTRIIGNVIFLKGIKT